MEGDSLAQRVLDEPKANYISNLEDTAIVSSISTVPVTIERKPYRGDDEVGLPQPGCARANLAPSKESPNGTTSNDWAARHQHRTVIRTATILLYVYMYLMVMVGFTTTL